MDYVPRLKNKYKSEIVENLKKNYKSVMQVPKLVKISLNQGVGNAVNDKKLIEAAQQEMTLITGQKAVLTKSRKDIFRSFIFTIMFEFLPVVLMSNVAARFLIYYFR